MENTFSLGGGGGKVNVISWAWFAFGGHVISFPLFASSLRSCLLLSLCKKKQNNGDKLLKGSITISVGCFDNPEEMLGMMKKFIEESCGIFEGVVYM
jgi:hypothetical protein